MNTTSFQHISKLRHFWTISVSLLIYIYLFILLIHDRYVKLSVVSKIKYVTVATRKSAIIFNTFSH